MQKLSRIPHSVRAIFFDAVGTLIHPNPSPGQAYAQIGRRHGSQLDPAEIRRRFPQAFQWEEKQDAQQGHRTDEQREYQRWQRIVQTVLDDVVDHQACFDALYDHFAHPGAWSVEPGTGDLVTALKKAGFSVGVASNFDHRLRDVVAGTPELKDLDWLVISSEIGWKKPAKEFFAELCRWSGLAAEEILLVGDDPENDLAGALAAGMHGLLLDPQNTQQVPAEKRLRSLFDLLATHE